MPKPSFRKNNSDTIEDIGDKGLHIFPKGFSPKVNVILPVEIELAHFEAAVQHFNNYFTMTLPYLSE